MFSTKRSGLETDSLQCNFVAIFGSQRGEQWVCLDPEDPTITIIDPPVNQIEGFIDLALLDETNGLNEARVCSQKLTLSILAELL